MKKKSLPSQNEIDNLTAQIEAVKLRVATEEKQGHTSTYWHDKLARLEGVLSELKNVESTED